MYLFAKLTTSFSTQNCICLYKDHKKLGLKWKTKARLPTAYSKTLWPVLHITFKIQSTLDISNSQRDLEIVRDIESSRYRVVVLLKRMVKGPNFLFERHGEFEIPSIRDIESGLYSKELRPISISVALAARAKRTALEHAQLELLRNIFSSLLYAQIVLKVECVSTFSAKRSEVKRPIWRSAFRYNLCSRGYGENVEWEKRAFLFLKRIWWETNFNRTKRVQSHQWAYTQSWLLGFIKKYLTIYDNVVINFTQSADVWVRSSVPKKFSLFLSFHLSLHFPIFVFSPLHRYYSHQFDNHYLLRFQFSFYDKSSCNLAKSL